MGRAPRLLLARRQVGLGSRLGLALGLGLGSPGLGLGSRLGLARELGSSGLGLGSWLGLDLALGRAFAGTSQPVAEYLHEMTVFPNGKHDDQVDSTAQFLDWSKRPFPSQGIFELMRMEAERVRNRERDQNSERFRVRLRAPPRDSRVRANLLAPTHRLEPGRNRRNVCRGRPILYPGRLD